ncbi:unnamed protein product [Caenorhabditis bovis]|uniref:Uncharacterized protein n=1 Tax=Caenorhabditis bovis TaxID=2654633 RepID=A0A8S1EGD5_9PELO|nr:unnamed protein product [Caenorhabditis bovis]
MVCVKTKIEPNTQVNPEYPAKDKSVYDAVQELGNPSYHLIPVHNEDPATKLSVSSQSTVIVHIRYIVSSSTTSTPTPSKKPVICPNFFLSGELFR